MGDSLENEPLVDEGQSLEGELRFKDCCLVEGFQLAELMEESFGEEVQVEDVVGRCVGTGRRKHLRVEVGEETHHELNVLEAPEGEER